MYSVDQILEGIRDPRQIIFKFYRSFNKNNGIKVIEEDWDNLIILDACRFDMFEELNYISGDLQMVRSSGANTGDFLQTNFESDTYPDTVYVSANPQIQLHNVAHRFYQSIPLWESEWDEELQTVPPGRVTERAIETHRSYPNKRLIIHFIQPHYPFIGETGQSIQHGEMIGDGIIKDERTHATIWEQLEAGEVTQQQVWQAYKENLALTLPHVEELVDQLDGKSVVTSDHGNAIGEWGIYGHPSVYIPPLVNVPWLVIDSDTRREIIRETVENRQRQSSSETVKGRLRALGYKN